MHKRANAEDCSLEREWVKDLLSKPTFGRKSINSFEFECTLSKPTFSRRSINSFECTFVLTPLSGKACH